MCSSDLARECERLLAPHRLAELCDLHDLIDVQEMRGREDHGLDPRIPDRTLEIVGQLEAVLFGEVARSIHLEAYAEQNTQPLALALHRFDDALAPATEPDHGSNPSGMLTNAKKIDGGYLLNGAKMWITNGSLADVAVVWAKLDGVVHGFVVEKGDRKSTRLNSSHT